MSSLRYHARSGETLLHDVPAGAANASSTREAGVGDEGLEPVTAGSAPAASEASPDSESVPAGRVDWSDAANSTIPVNHPRATPVETRTTGEVPAYPGGPRFPGTAFPATPAVRARWHFIQLPPQGYWQ